MQELVVLAMTMLLTWNMDYYPSSLDNGDVMVSYTDYSTVITINRTLVPADIQCTGSMQPFMGCSNRAYLERLCEDDKVSLGDIVAYKEGEHYVMHQVIGEGDGCYHLKGFNNIFEDQRCVAKEDIGYRAVIVLPTGG